MPEIYDPDETLLTFPEVTDNSVDIPILVRYFGRRYRHHASSVSNRYLFSYDNDFLTIMPLRSRYRVLGRVSVNFEPVSRHIDYDVYCVDTLERCINVFNAIISQYSFVF